MGKKAVVLYIENEAKQRLKQLNARNRGRENATFCDSPPDVACRKSVTSAQLVTSVVRSRNVNILAVILDKILHLKPFGKHFNPEFLQTVKITKGSDDITYVIFTVCFFEKSL